MDKYNDSVAVDASRCSSMFPWSIDLDRTCSFDLSADYTNLTSWSQYTNDSVPDDHLVSSTGHTEDVKTEYRNSAALAEDLSLMTELPGLCDVQFLVGVNRVPVFGVRAVLAVRCRAFHPLLVSHSKPLPPSQGTPNRKAWIFTKLRQLKTRKFCSRELPPSYVNIDIPECEPGPFKQLIAYLHTGTTQISLTNVIGLLNAADMYDVRDLRTACTRFVENSMRIHSVLALLKSSEPFGGRKITKLVVSQILDFIAERAADIFPLAEFETVSKKNVIAIFSRSDLNVSESSKWDAALRWSRRRSRKKGKRFLWRSMRMFCRRINFSEIPHSKLLSEVQPLAVVSHDVMQSALQPPRAGRQTSPAPRKPPRRRHVTRVAKHQGLQPQWKHLTEKYFENISSVACSTPKKRLPADDSNTHGVWKDSICNKCNVP